MVEYVLQRALSYFFVDNAVEVVIGGRSKDSQDVVQLVQVMPPRKDGSIGQHFRQDAAHGPNVDGFCVALEHFLLQYILSFVCDKSFGVCYRRSYFNIDLRELLYLPLSSA